MPKWKRARAKAVYVKTGSRHVLMVADPPRVVIPLRWAAVSGSPHAAHSFQRNFTFEVFVDGAQVSYALGFGEDQEMELSFRVDPGEYDVVIRQAAEGKQSEGTLVFAHKIRVAAQQDEDEV